MIIISIITGMQLVFGLGRMGDNNDFGRLLWFERALCAFASCVLVSLCAIENAHVNTETNANTITHRNTHIYIHAILNLDDVNGVLNDNNLHTIKQTHTHATVRNKQSRWAATATRRCAL